MSGAVVSCPHTRAHPYEGMHKDAWLFVYTVIGFEGEVAVFLLSALLKQWRGDLSLIHCSLALLAQINQPNYSTNGACRCRINSVSQGQTETLPNY